MANSEAKKAKREVLNAIFTEHGFNDFKWFNPNNIVVRNWVRIKCMYGCPEYGNNASCPPNTPSVSDCEKFFQEYKEAVVFHFEKHFKNPEDRHSWTKSINSKLGDVEKLVFLSGNVKAFLLFMDTCTLCRDCEKERKLCKHPKISRPTPEGMAVDVFTTVQALDYPIVVLRDYDQIMNRYAFLLVE
ncbi:MAG: DUF2284 domain-containing protein [Candidatus Hodarchaeales archaeon]|jgi:predicted metal-binding protein